MVNEEEPVGDALFLQALDLIDRATLSLHASKNARTPEAQATHAHEALAEFTRASDLLKQARSPQPESDEWKGWYNEAVEGRRMAETLESLKIVHQAIENLPAGPVNVDVDSKIVAPNQLAVYRSIEGLIQHFELVMTNRQFKTPVDEVYGATESPNGELGFYVVTDGSAVAYRARTRPPSFIHFAVFPYLIVGHQLSDVVAVLGSLNIIAAELDR